MFKDPDLNKFLISKRQNAEIEPLIRLFGSTLPLIVTALEKAAEARSDYDINNLLIPMIQGIKFF